MPLSLRALALTATPSKSSTVKQDGRLDLATAARISLEEFRVCLATRLPHRTTMSSWTKPGWSESLKSFPFKSCKADEVEVAMMGKHILGRNDPMVSLEYPPHVPENTNLSSFVLNLDARRSTLLGEKPTSLEKTVDSWENQPPNFLHLKCKWWTELEYGILPKPE